jgi:hypothetical protein
VDQGQVLGYMQTCPISKQNSPHYSFTRDQLHVLNINSIGGFFRGSQCSNATLKRC